MSLDQDLPKWVKDRGHPLPDHSYFIREDGAVMIRCPLEYNPLNLWVWKDTHEPVE